MLCPSKIKARPLSTVELYSRSVRARPITPITWFYVGAFIKQFLPQDSAENGGLCPIMLDIIPHTSLTDFLVPFTFYIVFVKFLPYKQYCPSGSSTIKNSGIG